MRIWQKFRSLVLKRKLDAEMAEEMREHLTMQVERNIAGGMSPEEARFAAQRIFGNVTNIQEEARDRRTWVWLEQGAQDIKYAVRQLRRNPGFTLTSVLVLALGIGANTAVFNLVHSLLLAPLTYQRPEEIVRLTSRAIHNSADERYFSYPAYREILEANSIFSDALASSVLVVGVGEKGDTRRAAAAVVSANYFSVLGITPAAGRTFSGEEAVPGSGAPVAIVSYSFWKKHHFDPALLGSNQRINGRMFTIVGIMPEHFTGTTALFYTEIWLPLGVYDQLSVDESNHQASLLNDGASSVLMVLGRLKPGLGLAGAQSGLGALNLDIQEKFPIEQKERVLALAAPSRFASAANDTAVTWVGVLLLGMAGIVLLVACLNLANMLLARGTARRKEIALRLALGGGRGRIVRQLLTEGFVLSMISGVAGLFLALWSSGLLAGSLARMIPIDLVWSAEPQPALFAATFGFCVLGTLGFALAPAIRLSRSAVMMHLKENAAEDRVRRRWRFIPRNPLVSAQLALSLGLLTAAALFIRSATRAGDGAMDTGLKTDRVFLVEVDAGLGGNDQTQTQDLYRRLEERLAALPGVESVGLSVDVPLGGVDLEKQVHRVGGESADKSSISAKWNGVSGDYFKAVGLPFLRGRAFNPGETAPGGNARVMIINDRLAKELWPNGDALGQRVQLDDEKGGASRASDKYAATEPLATSIGETYEVVGIVPAVRHNIFEASPDRGIYLPYPRGFKSQVYFQIKFLKAGPGGEAATSELLRRAIGEVDATLPILSLCSFAQHLDSNIQTWIVRAGAALFSAFGLLALCLAVVGTYGVVAYSVARRTREIGIRMALGAQPGAVQRMLLGEGAVMLGGGIAVGLLLAFGIGKIVSSLLYHVDPIDPVAFTLAPGLLAVSACLACWWPARRATRVDPMIALRAE